MYEKIFSIILIVALLNLTGCYSFQPVTVPEYQRVEEKEGKPNEIYVRTNDNQEYHFSESNYYIQNDTLFGKASAREVSFQGKFAISEIESIQTESFSVGISSYQKIVAQSGKPDEIYLTKLDSTRYHFMKDDYFIENDTLYGNGKGIFVENELLDRSIALSEIESIAFETSVSLNPAWVFGAVLLIAILIVLLENIKPVIIEWDEKS